MVAAFRARLLLLTALAAMAMPERLAATTIVVPSDASLAARAELIAAGRVVDVRTIERDGRLWTEAVVAVEERLKGSCGELIRVAQRGGTLGGRTSVIFGAPAFAAGERALLFLAAAGGAYRTVDLAAGKFTERTDRAGGRFWVRDLRASGLRVLASNAPESEPAVQRDAAAFERAIRGGSLDERAYLLPFVEPDGAIQAHFVTAAEPRIHRWFAFDDGGVAEWTSVGTQNGYDGGGEQEVGTALSLWAECPGVLIAYRYAGRSAEPPAGTAARNGRNEIFFGDPMDEIDGAWNGRDGIVAVGGFEAIASPRSWTSPFEADPGHPAGTFDAWAIVEGDVVVQDGIAPALGIPGNALAEILAHELGHTLGIGHSADPRAIMYARLQNFGAYLREDDRLAAQWLYPGSDPGAAPDAPLPAPSNLEVASMSSDLVRLTWTDNASDEAFQTIYVRPAGGFFAKLRDIGPDVTVANVTGLSAGTTYAFQVTARAAGGESAGSNVVETTVPRPPLVASFAAGPATGTAGITTFSFYDQSKGLIASRAWSFGDGDSSALASPTHVYRVPGAFTVRLTIRDDLGAESVFARTVVVNAPPPLLPGFSWSPAVPGAGNPVRFLDRTAGAPTRWTWTFGDGTTSTERDPIKTFAQPGRYTVVLDVQSGIEVARAVHEIEVGAATSAAASLD